MPGCGSPALCFPTTKTDVTKLLDTHSTGRRHTEGSYEPQEKGICRKKELLPETTDGLLTREED